MSFAQQPDAYLRNFLRDTGLVPPGDTPTWTPLAGGVSSDIWRVDWPGQSLCIKRALPRLKVAGTWHAPVERNSYEWAWLNFAATHCRGAVPEPVASDPAHGIFAMRFLDPARYPVWKRQLLDGLAPPETAAAVGTLIARLHAASAGDWHVAARFETDAIFHAIRLEPYLLATAARHPALAARLYALAERTASTHRALVHGDVSPKNILLGPDGPVFLDAECAWYGDPAFDAAFCLNHFLLKCIARPEAAVDFLRCFASFADAYLAGVEWEPRAAIEARIASLLPALILARIDGKSPVEYITEDRDRQRVRETACPLVVDPPRRIADVLSHWGAALGCPIRSQSRSDGAGKVAE